MRAAGVASHAAAAAVRGGGLEPERGVDRRADRGRAGFSLLELAVAITLLAVGLLTLLAATVRGLEQARRARAEAVAVRMAVELADSVAAAGAPAGASGSDTRAGFEREWSAVLVADRVHYIVAVRPPAGDGVELSRERRATVAP